MYLLLKLVGFVIGLTVEIQVHGKCTLAYTYQSRSDDPCTHQSPQRSPVCSPSILGNEDLFRNIPDLRYQRTSGGCSN